MTEATVLYKAHGAVALITLNRPAALNSLTRLMHHELWVALGEADTVTPLTVSLYKPGCRTW